MSMVLDPLGYSGRLRQEDDGEEEEEEVDVESGDASSMLLLSGPKDERKKLLASQLQLIKIYLLEPLSRHPKSTPFRKPVDVIALGIPDYPKIISKPMDLGTVKDKIRSRKYAHYRDALKDVYLIWKNAKTFNPQDHFIHKIALELEEFTKEKVSKIDFQNCRYTDLPSNKRRKVNSVNNNINSHNNNNNISLSSSNSGKSSNNNHHHHNLKQHPKTTSYCSTSSSHPPSKGSTTLNSQRLQKPPIVACREILEELVTSQVHSSYASPFKRLPRGRLDLIKLRNRLRRGVYVHPAQVADDFRSIIARTYRRSSDELSPTAQVASQLQHKFEVMYARRVTLDAYSEPKSDLTDPSVYTQTLLSAQDKILSIQSSLQYLFNSFYMAKSASNSNPPHNNGGGVSKRKKAVASGGSSSRKPAGKSFKRPLSEALSPPKKKVKVEQQAALVWSREEIIDLQTRIGQLDEHHQQPILSLMHKNGEKITEDEEGYVVLDIEEASSKSLSDIKDYIDSLPKAQPSPPRAALSQAAAVKEEVKSESESSSDSDDSSSDSSSEESSDED